MPTKSRIYLDTSALFTGIWSSEGGARLILRLGEARVIQILIGPIVLQEVREVLQRKAPEIMDVLDLVLKRSGIEITDPPSKQFLERSRTLVSNAGDVQVLASAWSAEVDYFVTLDRKHFLDNILLRNTVPFLMGTPGDCVAWYRENLIDATK